MQIVDLACEHGIDEQVGVTYEYWVDSKVQVQPELQLQTNITVSKQCSAKRLICLQKLRDYLVKLVYYR